MAATSRKQYGSQIFEMYNCCVMQSSVEMKAETTEEANRLFCILAFLFVRRDYR
jgi:hypothetical protein